MIRTQTTALQVPGIAGSSLSTIGSEPLLISSPRVAEAAARELERRGSLAGIRAGSVRADPLTTSTGAPTDLLQIIAQAETAGDAAAIANAYASAVDTVRTREKLRDIDRAMDKLRAQSRDARDEGTELELASQLQQLRAARTAEEDSTETVVAATPPATPLSPAPRRNTALAAVVSLCSRWERWRSGSGSTAGCGTRTSSSRCSGRRS